MFQMQQKLVILHGMPLMPVVLLWVQIQFRVRHQVVYWDLACQRISIINILLLLRPIILVISVLMVCVQRLRLQVIQLMSLLILYQIVMVVWQLQN